jgi:MFS family permease
VALLTLTVATVLADSSVVTLALPDILRDLDSDVTGVAWVIMVFNLVLAVVAVPVGWITSRRDAAPTTAVGLALFAVATAGCAFASSISVLNAARGAQALGGALALLGCLELLVRALGEQRGLARWIAAGVVGTAVGPVAGGLLTQGLSWRAVFAVQVPVALAAIPAAVAQRQRTDARETERERPAVAENLALALLSAALTAALFLLVLLLVDGFRTSPAVAALTVSVIPLAALASRPVARRLSADPRDEVLSGCVLIVGGLVGLALLPSAALLWTVPAQVLLGLGLGLTVDTLTSSAVGGRAWRSVHGGWSLGARHIGVVIGLAILTPVFTNDLTVAQVQAEQSIASLVIDAPLEPRAKVDLAVALGDQLTAEQGKVPDLHPAFAAISPTVQARQLQHRLDDQLERAAARAFRNAFLLAAGLAAAALVPLLWRRRP